MKTDKLYKEYLAENKRIDSERASLEADRKALVNELVVVEQEYGWLLTMVISIKLKKN